MVGPELGVKKFVRLGRYTQSTKELSPQSRKPMSARDQAGDGTSRKAFLTSPEGLVMTGFLAIGGAYLWMEHRDHLLGSLVFLPLLICPLMHLFMHRQHGNHSDHDDSSKGTSQ